MGRLLKSACAARVRRLASPPSDNDLLNGLISYWQLNEASGAAYNANYSGDSGYISFTNSSSSKATIPADGAETGDIAVTVEYTVPAAGGTPALAGRSTNPSQTWRLALNASNHPVFVWVDSGTVNRTHTIAVVVTKRYLAAELDIDYGASSSLVTFYDSDDGASWSSMGTHEVTTSKAWTSNNHKYCWGNTDIGTVAYVGKIYSSKVIDGTLSGGTVRVAWESADVEASSFTATTGETVTIGAAATGVVFTGYALTDNNNDIDRDTSNKVLGVGARRLTVGTDNLSRLYIASTSPLSPTGAFTVAGWGRYTSAPGGDLRFLISKDNGAAGGRQYHLSYNNVNIRFVTSSDGTVETAATTTLPSINTWFQFAGGYDGANNWISIDAGTRGTAAASAPYGSSSAMNLFNYDGGWYWNNHIGQIDEVGYWNRHLSTAEISTLYNSGAGKPYSEFGLTP